MTPPTNLEDRAASPRRSHRRRARAIAGWLAIGLAAATGLAACSSSSSTASTSTTTSTASTSGGSTSSTQASTAASTAKVPLVVYAAEGYDATVCAAFQKATGIPTKLEDNSTGTLLAQISAERNNPQWGVFWSDGDESYAALDLQGYLVRGFLPSTGTLNSLGTSLVPKDRAWVPTGVTIAGAIVYNSKVVSDPPTSWTQLLEPKWKGAVGMNNPALSGPTYPFVAGMMHMLGGVSAGERFFTEMKANGLHVFPTNKVTLTALLNGTIKLAIVQNSAGLGFAFKAPELRVAYPSKVTVLPSVIGIDAKVSPTEIAEAKRFASFVYSPAGQAAMLAGDPHGDSLFVPIVEGTVAHAAVPPLSSLPVQVLNPYTWGAREATVNSWFTNNIIN